MTPPRILEMGDPGGLVRLPASSCRKPCYSLAVSQATLTCKSHYPEIGPAGTANRPPPNPSSEGRRGDGRKRVLYRGRFHAYTGERRIPVEIGRLVSQSGGVVVALLLASVALEARGARPLAEVIASAPNRINPWADDKNPLPPIERLLGVDQQFWVKVGPPEASLSVSVVEPRGKSPSPPPRAARSWCSTACWPAAPPCSPPRGHWPMRATARFWSISAGMAARPAST